MADLAKKQDLHESKVAESEKWIQKAVNPANKGNLHKALHVAQGEKIPKAKIEKASHSKNPKLRHMAQFAKNVANEGTCPACNCSPCECVEEGNAFTGKLKSTPKGSSFKLGDKTFKDTSNLEEKKAKPDYIDLDGDGNRKETMKKAASDKKRSAGTAFDKEHMDKLRKEKEAETHGRYDVHDTGYSKRYTRKSVDTDIDKDAEVKSDAPKKKGRPAGPAKGPERTTKGAWKHKGERKVKEDGIPVTDRGEYDDEAGMAKDSLHTIVRHARELESALRSNENLPEWVQEKIGQIKGMMSSVTDYIISTHERDVEQHTGEEGLTTVIPEKAPPGAKAERMVKGIKKSLSKDGHLSDKDKAIAYATTWKAHKQGKVEEESTAEKDDKAERVAKKVTKDIEYDEGHKGRDDNKAEKAGKKVAKDIEYDDKKDKEEKVDETTVAGSVATATTSGKSSKGSMQFGKGVYESFNNSVEKMITESIRVESKMEECGDSMGQGVTITADGEEAVKLMQLLKLAGLEGCPTCGRAPCGCDELEENKPDWPTNTAVTGDDDPYLRRLSGGLNGPKSTGQTTIPVIAGQRKRMSTMEENVELERTLFKTWKNYKG